MHRTMHAIRRGLAWAALPYFRLELPGWRRLSGWVGLPMGNEAQWRDTAPRTIRGKSHGLLMRLHFQDWCDRLTYFLGRYYEVPLELLLRAMIRPGDTFVDVGGNVGMVTLSAAAAVGSRGNVYTFEPHPVMALRIGEAVSLNHLRNVKVFQVGLSDSEAELELTVVSEANGWSTFAPVERRDPALTYQIVKAKVVRGDEPLRGIAAPAAIKIDVEGFECRAVRGIAETIQRLHPAIITEVEPDLLRRAGCSAVELARLMTGYGYVGYCIHAGRSGLRDELLLARLSHPGASSTTNVLWLYPDGIHADRLKQYLRDSPNA